MSRPSMLYWHGLDYNNKNLCVHVMLQIQKHNIILFTYETQKQYIKGTLTDLN